MLTENLGYYLNLYDLWSSYRPEEEGIVVAYASIYGNTRKAALLLADALEKRGAKVVRYDLARSDIHAATADAFRYSHLVLASPTYNGDIFPFMKEFIHHLTERSYQNRTVAFVENGSWTPLAAKVMGKMLEGSKNLTIPEPTVKVYSAVNDKNLAEIETLADALMA